MAAQLEITAAKNEAKIGEELDVLCEGFDTVAECFYGRSAAETPPRLTGKVYFRLPEASDRPNQGDFVRVRITEAMDYDLVGEML